MNNDGYDIVTQNRVIAMTAKHQIYMSHNQKEIKKIKINSEIKIKSFRDHI